jgi:hypothetical protein
MESATVVLSGQKPARSARDAVNVGLGEHRNRATTAKQKYSKTKIWIPEQ